MRESTLPQIEYGKFNSHQVRVDEVLPVARELADFSSPREETCRLTMTLRAKVNVSGREEKKIKEK